MFFDRLNERPSDPLAFITDEVYSLTDDFEVLTRESDLTDPQDIAETIIPSLRSATGVNLDGYADSELIEAIAARYERWRLDQGQS